MCGIVGWLSPGRQRPNKATLERMTRTLTHRGPDGQGVYLDGRCGFGHRRLSIVDLEGGAQPMVTADGAHAITFNGEIFNHATIRRDLEKLGHAFVTRGSDTETLLRGLRQWGVDILGRLNGMFAFAAWDKQSETAIIARDRMGQKPLYYAHLDDGTLLFASEPKALLAHPKIEPVLDPVGIALYLTYEYVPYPYSAFRGIRKLPPGDYLVWNDGKLSQRTYSTLPFSTSTPARSDAEWIEALRTELGAATERRLMADVPLGVFLSGGIDSSAVVALMAERVAGPDIQTFSIAFDDASFDESDYARMVAKRFGTTHHTKTFTADEMLETLPRVVDFLDEPFGDASVLPTHLLSRFTRGSVKVAIGGDGGDELFCGYETFRADTAARGYRLLPAPIRAAIRGGVQHLPVSRDNFSLDFILKSFVRGADANPEFRHTRWLSSFLPNTEDDPLRRSIRDAIPDGHIFRVMADAYRACPDPRHLQKLSHAYLRTYMAEDILTKVDRASMGTSLEVRSPFMDPALVSLAVRMPSRLKLRRGFQAKYVLKKALENDLPHEILYRKKKGFGIPVGKWLNGPLASEADRLLAPDRMRDGGLLEPSVVTRLLGEHRAGKRDNRKQLWTLMMLEYWRERHDVRV